MLALLRKFKRSGWYRCDCGKELKLADGYAQRYTSCGRNCPNVARAMVAHRCLECGGQFMRKEAKRPAKYCDRTCATAARNRLRKTPEDELQRTCLHCRSTFTVAKPSHVAKFCSVRCKALYWGPRQTPRGAAKWDPAYSPFKPFVNKAQRSARNRPRLGPVTVTVQSLKALWERQGGKCPISGLQLGLPRNSRHWGGVPRALRASLDRIDSARPYSADNVQFIAIAANHAKSVWFNQDVVDMARAVVNWAPLPRPVLAPQPRLAATNAGYPPELRKFTALLQTPDRQGLSHHDLQVLWEAQGERCALTGWPLDFTRRWQPRRASLDRIDPSRGYTLDNVRIVALIVNLGRNALNDSQFREFCQAVIRA